MALCVVAGGFIVNPAIECVAFRLDVLDPLTARGWAARRSRFQDLDSWTTHFVGMMAVNGPCISSSRKAAKEPIGKSDFRKPIVSDVARRPASNQRRSHADPNLAIHTCDNLLRAHRFGQQHENNQGSKKSANRISLLSLHVLA